MTVEQVVVDGDAQMDLKTQLRNIVRFPQLFALCISCCSHVTRSLHARRAARRSQVREPMHVTRASTRVASSAPSVATTSSAWTPIVAMSTHNTCAPRPTCAAIVVTLYFKQYNQRLLFRNRLQERHVAAKALLPTQQPLSGAVGLPHCQLQSHAAHLRASMQSHYGRPP